MEAIPPVQTRIRPLMWLLAAIAAFGAIVTAAVLIRGVSTPLDSRTLGGGVTMLVCAGLGIVYFVAWLRNARLLVGPDSFGFQDIIGRRRTWTASEVGKVLDVTIAYSKSFSQPTVLVLGLDGRRLMAVNPFSWDRESIDRFIRATGKPAEIEARVTAREFRRDYPRAMGWASTHPNLMGGLLGVGLMVLAIAIPIATMWIHW